MQPMIIGSTNARSVSYGLHIRASKEFSFDSGKSKLLGLNLAVLGGDLARLVAPGDTHANVGVGEVQGRQGTVLQLSGFLDMSCEIAVGEILIIRPLLKVLGRLCWRSHWIPEQMSR
jgi:DNA mismatch repair protein MSH5